MATAGRPGLPERCGHRAIVDGMRVICRRGVEHRTSKEEDRRRHYDPDLELFWSTADEQQR